MPKKRIPYETWRINIRPIIWNRDNRQCIRCKKLVLLNECHIDHIVSGLSGDNTIQNLRTLCRKCHVLRADHFHQGMIAKALKDGVITADWRKHVWEEESLLRK
ncbi:HNH endonuclease signature motif containing protein [Bacillus thuringiensis]|uniref:HNH endonuclease n=1 Tax=Bacillus thuringiensis TaxID=1428 RepID=A0A9W3XJ24_BACTU|nr:HNH endonuclease signature motif containing protein [Bacillus thuringiensis]AQY39148.1 HNH endonuclease [Bacillus thuringiensis]MDR4150121.1 HNH endonuclease [Bacillus thuringiensis]MEC3573867.1 HNH endonuclease signature motif containing protein [Bacillus thuringiensis]MED2022394.1 HNH endonuclease signature motif containing protein [Bacillus thuringiensis]MED2143631.1 HNH endonuclease signature motif containing protein [Bacillus thuringiensis]